jgi:hypothetical protein
MNKINIGIKPWFMSNGSISSNYRDNDPLFNIWNMFRSIKFMIGAIVFGIFIFLFFSLIAWSAYQDYQQKNKMYSEHLTPKMSGFASQDRQHLVPYFHGGSYYYGRHRYSPQHKGMKIGQGYIMDTLKYPSCTKCTSSLRDPNVQSIATITLYTWDKCGYCKDFEASGTWERLKKKFGQDFVFEKKQRSTDEIPPYINSFPTIVSYINKPNEDKLMYSGDRSYNNLDQWITSQIVNL